MKPIDNGVPFERVVKRGQMYYVHKSPPFKNSREIDPKRGRPAIIVSRDEDNFMSGTVEIVYLTGERHIKFLRETQFKLSEGTIARSVAKCEQIDTVDKQCLGDYIGDLSEEDISTLNAALMKSLGIEPPTSFEDCAEKQEMTSHIRQLTIENQRLKSEVLKAEREEGSASIYKEEAERYKTMYKDLVQTLAGR